MFKKYKTHGILLVVLLSVFLSGCFGFLTPDPTFTVEGVEDGKNYDAPVTPVITAGKGTTLTTTLNGEPFESNTTITENGEYELVVVGKNKNDDTVTDTIGFSIDISVPIITVTGVEDGGYYWEAVNPVITTDDENDTIEAWLNDEPYTLGTPIDSDGTHTLKVKATSATNKSWEVTRTFEVRLGYPPVLTLETVVDEDGALIGIWKDRQGGVEFNEDPAYTRSGDTSLRVNAGWPIVVHLDPYSANVPHPSNVKDWSAYDKLSFWVYLGDETEVSKMSADNTFIVEVTNYVRIDRPQIENDIGADGWLYAEYSLSDLFLDGIVLDDNTNPLKITFRGPQHESVYYIADIQLIMAD